MKDKRQGAASIVFLVYYSFIFSFLAYLIVTRRPKRYIFGPIFFAFLRLGANIASLGWAIHLYENFDWLIASLILGAEGYFALIISVLFCMVGYELEFLGNSVFYPKRPEGRNKFLHRFTHVGFYFEYSLIPANVLLVIGASQISGALSKASATELIDPTTIPKVRQGQTLRIIGQSMFLAAIIVGYALLAWIIRKAGQMGKDRTALWWLAASGPLLIVRGCYGVLSAADWGYSYYIPSNYGANGLKSNELIAEYLMAITMEALALFCITRAVALITVKRQLFVPYDKRDETGRMTVNAEHANGGEDIEMKPGRTNQA